MTNPPEQMASPPARVRWRRRASDPVSRVGCTAERNSPSCPNEATGHTLVTEMSVLVERSGKAQDEPRNGPGASRENAGELGYYAKRVWILVDSARVGMGVVMAEEAGAIEQPPPS